MNRRYKRIEFEGSSVHTMLFVDIELWKPATVVETLLLKRCCEEMDARKPTVFC